MMKFDRRVQVICRLSIFQRLLVMKTVETVPPLAHMMPVVLTVKTRKERIVKLQCVPGKCYLMASGFEVKSCVNRLVRHQPLKNCVLRHRILL